MKNKKVECKNKNCNNMVEPEKLDRDGFCSRKCSLSYSGYFWNKRKNHEAFLRSFFDALGERFEQVRDEHPIFEQVREVRGDFPLRQKIYGLYSGRRAIFKVKLTFRTIPKIEDEFNLCLDLSYGTPSKRPKFDYFLLEYRDHLELDLKNEIEGELREDVRKDLVFRNMDHHLRIAERRIKLAEGVNIEELVVWGSGLLSGLIILLGEDYIEEYEKLNW